MLSNPTKTEDQTAANIKAVEKQTEQRTGTENKVIEKDPRKDYDIQAVDTKVIPSQR